MRFEEEEKKKTSLSVFCLSSKGKKAHETRGSFLKKKDNF